MGQVCDVCKERLAVILIEGKGQYCYDCHNKITLVDYGMSDTFEYSKTMSVIEPGGNIHTFEVNHIILGSIVKWEAREKVKNYEFKEISDIEENGAIVAQRFFKKIVDGVCTKTLETSEGLFGKTLSLKEKGVIRIIEDENREHQTAFQMDDKIFTPEEFGELLREYVGFNMQFQIHDESDPLLGEHEYLVPAYITKESLIEEFEVMLEIHGDRGFVSYKNVMRFEDAFYKIHDKLKIIDEAMNRAYAQEIGKELVKRLHEIKSDDDYFPYNLIELVCKTVDPFGTDDKLWGYMEAE